MLGPDDIDDMRPESPMPPPERSAEWLAGWRAAQEAAAQLAHRFARMPYDGGDPAVVSLYAVPAAIRAMRPEGER